MAEDFAISLTKLNNSFEIDRFDEYKERALVSLVIAFPE